jgi:hypothetical protein
VDIGGHGKVPRPALKKAFESMGLRDARTVLRLMKGRT